MFRSQRETARVETVRDQDGDIETDTGQELGFHAYQTEVLSQQFSPSFLCCSVKTKEDDNIFVEYRYHMITLDYCRQEGRVKRLRQEDTVEKQMIQDLTQPETTDEQPNYSLRTPWATTERADFYALKEIPRVKRIDKSLHATSKELTFSNLKNRGVEKRLKFRLRVISRYCIYFGKLVYT